MRHLLLLFPICLSASTCSVSFLSTYDSSGFSCTEGSEVFSNFSFMEPEGSVPASSIEVTPLSDGLEFSDGFSVPTGQSLDIVLSYTESGAAFTGDTLTIRGFGQSNGGSIDVSESVNGLSLNVFDDSTGSLSSDTVTLNATSLSITKDISVIGPANLSVIDNVTPSLLSVNTPEPSGLLCLIVLLSFLAATRKLSSTR